MRRDHPVLEAIGIVVFFGALVAAAPGALLTFAVEHVVRAELDTTQRWTWAIGSSVMGACAMSWRSRRGHEGLGRYMLVAVATAAFVMIARFGTHARWASEMLGAYVP